MLLRDDQILASVTLVLFLYSSPSAKSQIPPPALFCDCKQCGLCAYADQKVGCGNNPCCCKLAKACEVECEKNCNCVIQPPIVGIGDPMAFCINGAGAICNYDYVITWAKDPNGGKGCICPIAHWTTMVVMYRGGPGCPAAGSQDWCNASVCPTCSGCE
jgi:hypothetical protein